MIRFLKTPQPYLKKRVIKNKGLMFSSAFLKCLKLGVFLSILILAFQIYNLQSQDLLNIKNGANLYLNSNALLYINGSVNINTGASLTQTGSSTINILNNWTNNGTYSCGNGTVNFIGANNDSIKGTSTTTFWNLVLNKSLGTYILSQMSNLNINNIFTLTQGIWEFNNLAAHSLSISGNLTVPSTSIFRVQSSGSATHSLSLSGNLTNSNIFNLNNGLGGVVNTTFTGSTNSLISGLGGTTNFNQITLNKSAINDTVQVSSNYFTVPSSGFLTLNGGLFRLSDTLTNPVFLSSSYTIPSNSGLWLDNSGITVTGTNNSLILQGILKISNGAMNIGTGSNENNLLYGSGTSAAKLQIDNGSLIINARISRNTSTTDSLSYIQNGGTVSVGAASSVSSTTRGLFDIGAAASSFSMSNGTIELKNTSPSFSNGEFYVNTSNGTVSGGTLKINALSASQTYRLYSLKSVGNLLMTGTNNPIVQLIDSLSILNNLTIAGSGSGRFNANNYNMNIGGIWINNSSTDSTAFTAGTGKVTFNGSSEQRISGSSRTTFNDFTINKSNLGSSDTTAHVVLDTTVLFNGTVRLVSNSLVYLQTDSVILGTGTYIYSDDYPLTDTSFNNKKCIFNSLDTLDYGGLIRKRIATSADSVKFYCPIGTYHNTSGVFSNKFTPALIEIYNGFASYGSNASISVKCIPQEHPKVETNGYSLKKYWTVKSNDITFLSLGGCNLRFYYDSSEEQGSTPDYYVFDYTPPYPNINGYWHRNPGRTNNIVNFGSRFFYSNQADSLIGDWTAGEDRIGKATYFSRQNGRYDDINTWSKDYFGGPVANSIPNKRSDRVWIRHTVTIDSMIAPAGMIIVDTGLVNSVSSIGVLRITGNNYAWGDSLQISDGTRFEVGNPSGFTANLLLYTGAVQSSVYRNFSSNAVYKFIGTDTVQYTGDGIPSPVRSLICEKTDAADTLKLSKTVLIKDSLVINQGVLDKNNFSIDGYTSGRTLTMRGGELLTRTTFPENYNAPTFTSGKITFNNCVNPVIPSSTSTPAVNQYNDLSINGNVSGTVTFSPNGEVRIKNNLDISKLVFTGSPTTRFYTNGSTLVFNKNGGTQNIPTRSYHPSDTTMNLQYYNLKVDSSGIKQLYSDSTVTFVIQNNLIIIDTASLQSNGYNLEVLGSWTNTYGTFNPGTSYVIFDCPVIGFTNNISSRSTVDNPFYHLTILGHGEVHFVDSVLVNGNLYISDTSTMSLSNNKTLKIYGNWTNHGGTFTPNNSTVIFNGSSTQTISKTVGNENFYNLIINNPNNVNCYSVGASSTNGTIINNNLTLTAGILRSHSGANYRYVTVLDSIIRSSGTYIDGELRVNVPVNTTSVPYYVGFGNSYTPVTLDFNGTGGTAGVMGILCDTVNTTSSPIAWNSGITDFIPGGSTININKHVPRQYKVSIPVGSSFVLGTSRTYNATMTYINPGDLRGGANPSYFEARILSGSTWISPHYYGTTPNIGTKTSTSLQYSMVKDTGAILVGEPGLMTYYTRNNGNWNNDTTWSTQGYGQAISTTYPGQINNNYKVYIGNGFSVSLTSSITDSNGISGNGIIQIDSSGILMCQGYKIYGNAEFRLTKDGTLGIGDTNGIMAAAASGNIQTTIRNYNYNTHNRGHFIYTGPAVNQGTGDGLPSTVAVLNFSKNASTDSVHLMNAITISDSMYISTGKLRTLANIILNGNLRREAGTMFYPGTSTFTLGGTKIDTITNLASDSIQFYNLTLNKAIATGGILLGNNTKVFILDTLNFTTNVLNKCYIDAFTKSGTYVMLGTSGVISNASDTRGWVYGELRLYVPTTGNTQTIFFNIGDSLHFSPFQLVFNGAGLGTAGYLAAKVITGNHPYLFYPTPPIASTDTISIDPSRVIGPKYWRITKPRGSAFIRSTRTFNPRAYFIVPGDDHNVDYWGCVDMSYIRRWTGVIDWQRLYAQNTASNDGTTGCGDTRSTTVSPTFTYSGVLVGDLAYVNCNTAINAALGSTEIINNDTLLADFVAGNQNTLQRFYNFYSVKSGNWTDPTIWSTISLTDTVSPTNGAVSDTTGGKNRLNIGFPRRQYDNVYIGNGKRVVLDANIGTGTNSSDLLLNTLRGPSVVINDSGTLALNQHVLRYNTFAILAGGILESGSSSGLTHTSSGNINLGGTSSTPPHYSDSISVIYTAEGKTSDITSYYNTWPNPNASANYIQQVNVRSSGGTLLMQNISLDSLARSSYGISIYTHKKAILTAGSSYYLEIIPGGTGYRYYTVWIDTTGNGTFTQMDTTSSALTTLITMPTFSIPAGATQRSTQMRVGMSTTNGFSATNSSTGEYEDYTVDITNPNTVISQNSGTVLDSANIVKSLIIHSPRTSSSVTFNFGLSSVWIMDTLKIMSGVLNNGAKNIYDYHNFENDTLNGFNCGTGSVNFIGSSDSYITGTKPIVFNNDTINKTNVSAKIYCNDSITVKGSLTLSTDNKILINKAITITIDSTGSISPGGGSYSNKRMFQVVDTSQTVNITKRFPYQSVGLPGTLTYRLPSLATTGQYITRVTFGTLDNNNNTNSGYADYTGLTPPTITAGTNTTLTIYKSSASTTYYYAVWFDLNHDSTFAVAAPEYYSGNFSALSQNVTINIPTTAYNGITRMRVRIRATAASTNAYEISATAGEFEDYLVNITGATAPPVKLLSMFFPIGNDTIYNPAEMYLRLQGNCTPTISHTLYKEWEPHRLTNNILNKFWQFSTTGMPTNYLIDSLKLHYNLADINGQLWRYIPGRWKSTYGWEINLGTNPRARVTGTDSLICTIDSCTSSVDGNWVVGEPLVYFYGRVFYSIQPGVWNNKFNWSNDPVLKHNGSAASYFPGMLFVDDTVNIDGHTITFQDSLHIVVDSLRIGGTNTNLPHVQGQLIFSNSPTPKTFETRQLFLDSDGLITGTTPAGGRADTLLIRQNLRNQSTAAQIFRNDNNDYTTLYFYGNLNSQILGEGSWSSLADIVMNKSGGLSDSLTISSKSFVTATRAASNYTFRPWAGVMKYMVNDSMYLSSGNTEIDMGSNSGFEFDSGKVVAKSNFVTNNLTTTYLNGGNFTVGDAANENFLYKTGSNVTVRKGTLDISGCFTRHITGSLVNFYMDTMGLVRVLRYNSVQPSLNGFDIANTFSRFSMDSGRIVITRPVLGSLADYYVSVCDTCGNGMIRGTIQVGDTSIAAPSPFKIKGSMPIANLHLANAPGNATISQFNEQLFTIKKDFNIDVNDSVQFQGNYVAVGGNINNYGTFNNSSGTLKFIGNGNTQKIFNKNSPALTLFNVSMAKTGGGVVLLDTAYSNMKIENNLEFSLGNLGLINSRTNSKYVELTQTTSNVILNGYGHINGLLYRNVGTDVNSILFPIGSDTVINSYRPVLFETVGSGGTAGRVGAIEYNINHPDIANAAVDTLTNIQRYWNISSPGTFSLGTRTFNLTTYFRNPGDTIGRGPTIQFLEHKRRTPDWATNSTPNPLFWFTTTTSVKTDTSIKSINNINFGDYIIAEPAGQTFYSIQNGYWNSNTTWSLSGYLTPNLPPAGRYPGRNGSLVVNNDKVYIGNGKKVTLPATISPYISVVATTVEKYPGLLPGELDLEGDINVLNGNAFQLGDSCSLGLQQIEGIAPVGQTSGAIQTVSRTFGVSRYIYYSSTAAQSSGRALPDSIMALIINNNNSINPLVAISNYTGANTIKVSDSIQILNGNFSNGNRNITMYGNFSAWNSGTFNQGNIADFNFAGNGFDTITIGNQSGLTFYKLGINYQNNGTLYSRKVSNSATANFNISTILNFLNSNANYLSLGDNQNLYMLSTNFGDSIVNYSPNRFILTRKNSGYLVRNINPGGGLYSFPVGSSDGTNNLFAPAFFLTGTGGTSGNYAVKTNPGSNPANVGEHAGQSNQPFISYLRRYWSVDTMTAKIPGTWTFYFNAVDTAGSTFERIGRWRPINEGAGGLWQLYQLDGNFLINTSQLYFKTQNNFDYSQFYGDWTFGSYQSFKRIFYSRQNGIWGSDQSWTFVPSHIGNIFGTGVFPSNSSDSVVIGHNHEITLDTNEISSGVNLGMSHTDAGTLNCGTFFLLCNYFIIGDSSHLKIGSPYGITLLGNNTGNIRASLIRNYNSFAIYEYNGTTNQIFGNGLPNSFYSLIINNTGPLGNNTVSADTNKTITNNLTINTGRLDLQTYLLNTNPASLGIFTIAPNATLRIGGSNDLKGTVNNYASYIIDSASYIEFYGGLAGNQIFSNRPANLFQNFSLGTGGLGNVIINNPGTKLVTAPLLIRGNLIISNNATLLNSVGVDALSVRKNVINSANVNNNGIIEIGQ